MSSRFRSGSISATHQYAISDYLLTFVGFLGLATPSFLLAAALGLFRQRLFGISIGGLMDPRYVDAPWSLPKAISVLAHIWIPVIVIGTAGTASMIRRLRANLLDELQKQYVVTPAPRVSIRSSCCSNIRCASRSTRSSRISAHCCRM